ncbi:reverse transcriptase domain-containing protein [Cupriavidus pauculus]|uniref:reverse transcriptase domain-containing protein n=1 Tax=Cupriavidus pauculus TaxID=82633 RepID=UPI0012489F7A|nr:reverse transcriptase domain-containing protein [Cupriavidus pauculus]KAB0598452.1 RNA-directed DNA polymerase [Cupriavidus pauculus]MCM3608350.1 reverse transcriptase domain-containing protein [Cupriavidus pauculus]UAL00498.1 hypothetical protein K8O84_03800 [Cupriavidus pauculus]
MTTSAYYQVLSRESLDDTWQRLYRRTKPSSRNTAGVDGISINDFERDAKANLSRLSKEIRQRSFKLSPLSPSLIPKPNGKDRLICVPTVRDRLVQRALLSFLAKKYGKIIANKISYGFIQHRSVKMAAEAAISLRSTYPWAFKTDITSFFDRIPRDRLTHAIRSLVKETSLHPILTEIIGCEIAPTSRGNERRIRRLGIRDGLGVRQGMPLSPFFANAILIGFDAKIVSNGWQAVRYADDLLFLGKTEDECHEIARQCKQWLSELSLEIPEIGPGSKSSIHAPDEAVEFLGLNLARNGTGYALSLSPTQRQRIRDEMLALGSIKELISRRLGLASLGQVISAKKDGYLAAYDICSNLSEIENDLNEMEYKVLRKLYVDELHIDLKRLTPDARKFLGI